MVRARYLTKSRFKLAVECPTKLFYTGKPKYRDALKSNDFLKALAEGGYQVGALAQLMFPAGIEIEGLDADRAVAETEKYLKNDSIVLFEPAIRVGNFLVRIDILIKSGNTFELIEVKAKSFNSFEPNIEAKRGGISSAMLPYIQDVAFQTWVLRQAFPNAEISSSLMMPDKSKVSTLDGINQMFKIYPTQGGYGIKKNIPEHIDATTMSRELLVKVPVDEYVATVLNEPLKFSGGEGFLSDLAIGWATAYRNDEQLPPKVGAQCGQCQFISNDTDDGKSGFHECWSQTTGLSADILSAGTVLDLWNFRGKQRLIDKNIYRLEDIEQSDLGEFDPVVSHAGLSRPQRQWLQIAAAQDSQGGQHCYFNREFVAAEMSAWKYPLHFIDFETSSVALPFYRGMRPYEPVAFQFSHHRMEANGTVSHVGEYLEVTPGKFPNFDFARALKKELEADEGTVFMWSHHENTILSKIAEQLAVTSVAPSESDELINFLQTLTRGGQREMVDLCKISEKAFFHPATKGSNSIKKVLPAILESSPALLETYSKPIYGSSDGIPSKNFSGTQGIAWIDDVNTDPYVKLRSIAKGLLLTGASEDSVIAEGGAAATAYSRVQFEELNAEERERIKASLLRYCELDTLAMVMVVQGWQGFVGPIR